MDESFTWTLGKLRVPQFTLRGNVNLSVDGSKNSSCQKSVDSYPSELSRSFEGFGDIERYRPTAGNPPIYSRTLNIQ